MFAIINKNMHVFIFQFNDYDKIDKFKVAIIDCRCKRAGYLPTPASSCQYLSNINNRVTFAVLGHHFLLSIIPAHWHNTWLTSLGSRTTFNVHITFAPLSTLITSCMWKFSNKGLMKTVFWNSFAMGLLKSRKNFLNLCSLGNGTAPISS